MNSVSEERFHIGKNLRIHSVPLEKQETNERFRVKEVKKGEINNRDTVEKFWSKNRSKERQCGQEHRQKLLTETCHSDKSKGSVNIDPQTFHRNVSFKSFFVDDVHKVLYCEVPKVACTSWKVFFANLTGKVKPKDYGKLHHLVHNTDYFPKVGFRFLNSYTYEERMYRLKHYLKFMVVRNPFTRLVSAYENKFLHDGEQSQWFQANVGTKIIKKYRKKPSKKSLQDGKDVQFNELIQFITDDKNREVSKYDRHWWRVHGLCLPCLVDYDYIAKLETLEEDLNNILERIVPGQSKRFPYLNANSQDNAQKVREYYNNLSLHDLERIQKFYNIDSRLFGYDLHENDVECHT